MVAKVKTTFFQTKRANEREGAIWPLPFGHAPLEGIAIGLLIRTP